MKSFFYIKISNYIKMTKKQILFEKSFASHENAKYWSDKNIDIYGNFINPINVYKSSKKDYLFNCNCGHEFNSPLDRINRGCWCPYCCNPAKKLCGDISCKTCFNKSFASINLISNISWSNKNVYKKHEVLKSGDKVYLFHCDECNHTFDTQIKTITRGDGCPFCSNKRLCGDINCKICFDKSFASFEKSKYILNENPYLIVKGSHKQYNFNCDKCQHIFISTPEQVIFNRWCNYCANKILCSNENCNLCFNKSFASINKSLYWDYEKNNGKPRDYFKSSCKEFWFNCNKCSRNFENRLSHISSGVWCGYCIKRHSKGQIEWLNFIQIKDGIIIQHAENIGEFIISNTNYKADGYCKETNTIYEYHGDFWHGNPNKYVLTDINPISKKTFGELYQKTLEREQQIRDLGFNLITIWESDWIKLNKCVKLLQRKFRNSKLH